MILSKKIKISLVVFILIEGFLLVFFIYPLFKQIKINSSDLISQKKDLTETKIKTKNLRKFQTFFKTHRESLKKIDDLFIDAETPLEFIKFLEETATVAGVSLEISPGTYQKEKPWPFMNFQLRISGSFANFLRFLEKLESAPYLIKISRLHSKRLKEKTGDIRAVLSMKAYSKPK